MFAKNYCRLMKQEAKDLEVLHIGVKTMRSRYLAESLPVSLSAQSICPLIVSRISELEPNQ